MENKILAKVGTTPITDADVTAFLASLGQRGAEYDNPKGRAVILSQLISSRLFLLDAKRNLLEAEPQFTAMLARAKDDLLTNYAVEKLLAGLSVTDAEAKKFYDENADKFGGGQTVNASHILVDSEEKAKEIYEKIVAGDMSFEEAAKSYSFCPSKEQGGELGDFGRGQMVPEFDTAVFSMEVGEITKTPVKTQFGYHLIRLNSKRDGAPIAFDEIKEQVKAQLLGEKQQKAYESRVNQLKILYPVDILG